MPSKTILITDRDLGFVFWLGQLLDDAGYQALPARSSVDAIALQNQFHLKIDLLILNPSLVGYASSLKRYAARKSTRGSWLSLMNGKNRVPYWWPTH